MQPVDRLKANELDDRGLESLKLGFRPTVVLAVRSRYNSSIHWCHPTRNPMAQTTTTSRYIVRDEETLLKEPITKCHSR
jgi:hypothetical protein